ncbi:SiaC family regulatory phosphoprotein [Bernardetia sp.]|uniref:SiaC family regulatory phosphoprotein n=1 Tax=Bernardetia sp. TaxID=1937974 RepID=UPI0025BA350F|nr:SiaC family regulatory phosphoprotein [Bernardetia sp.]
MKIRDIKIESKANNNGLRASILASAKQKKIIISNWANCFTAEELLPFEEWLEGYLQNNEEILTIELIDVLDSLPFTEPREENFIIKKPLPFMENITNPLTEIIKTIPNFNFLIEGKWGVGNYASGRFPKIKGNFETGVVEISQEMYNSYSLYFMHPFFCWLEKLFQSDIDQIHSYFKIDYIATSNMIRLVETATALSSWSEKTGKTSLWTWYCLDDDEDTKEWFNDIFKMSNNLSHIKMEAIELDERQWNKILK